MRTIAINFTNAPSLVKFADGKVYTSNDGGKNWTIVIDGDGVRGVSVNGVLNTEQLRIYNGSIPTFTWNKDGINAYEIKEDTDENGNTTSGANYTKFVRFDQYGLYGISNYSANGGEYNTYFKPGKLQDVKNNADFGFVWGEFFLKSAHNGGLVRISSDDDIQVLTTEKKDGETVESERIKIGLLDKTSNLYGLRIKNSLGATVMQTDSDGNLEISGKITAQSGSIGGFDIEANQLSARNITSVGNNEVILSPRGIALGTDIEEDSIRTAEFFVTPEGELHAKNATIEGTLKTSVFEKDSTRVVGGTSIFKSAAIIDKNRTHDNEIYLENDEGIEEFSTGNIVSIYESGLGTDGIDTYYEITEIESVYKNYSIEEGYSQADTYYILENEEYKKIQITKESNKYYSQIYNADGTLEEKKEIENFQITNYYKLVKAKIMLGYSDSSDIIKIGDNGTLDKGKDYLLVYIAKSLQEAKDWVIGINSTADKRALNLYPNSISFSDINLDKENHSIDYDRKVVIGDLSFLGKEDIFNGLYAKNAYLQGSFYANQGENKNQIAINDKGINFGNSLVYDTATDTLWIGANTIIHGKYDDSQSGGTGEDIFDNISSGGTENNYYQVQILSSNGEIFKNGNIKTTLVAHVFKNGVDITDTLHENCFSWFKVDSNGVRTNWKDNTKKIEITSDLVSSKAIFEVEVNFES